MLFLVPLSIFVIFFDAAAGCDFQLKRNCEHKKHAKRASIGREEVNSEAVYTQAYIGEVHEP